jgi:hypothetical protein
MYECCADLGVVDRLGDLMQRKVREFQAAQVARNAPAPAAQVHPMGVGSPPRAARKSDLGMNEEGFICGSSNFQDVAAYSSSYKGQARWITDSVESHCTHAHLPSLCCSGVA